MIADCRLLIEDWRPRTALGLICGLLLLTACRTPLPGPEPVMLKTPADGAEVHLANVAFEWDLVTGAASYELQIDDKATFITPVIDTSDIEALNVAQFLPDGDYHWRVRGRGTDSVWGDWSEVRSLQVLTYVITARIQTRGYPQGIDVRGDYAFIADGEAGLSIYDVSDPDSLKLAASIMDTTNSAFGVSVAGHYAYLAYGRKQIQVIDIARLDSMKMLGSIGYTTGYAYDIEALDTTTVVVANHGKFSVFDVTDPNFPILLYEPHSPARSVVVRDMTAYLACEQVGVQIATVSRTSAPVTLSIFRTPGNARDVAVAGNYAYVADGREGLTVLDITDRANPSLAGTLVLPGGGYANKVAVADNMAYMADGTAGVAVIDVSNPAAPELRAMLKTTEAKAVFVREDGQVFATDRDWGLLAIEKADEP